MKPIYPDDGDGDREAVPGPPRDPDGAVDTPPRTLDVDGQTFALRRNECDGTDYTWLSGPNPGYGFGASPTLGLSLDQHRKNIRDFLAMVDPATGRIEDD
ncbi:hypothetical protein [Micromonospora sp. NPDC005710]|uniref:hypothetical protein n=1 Tax=Micromonospora sp. NPDC005710 TaxID=3157051 RepID=UPI003409D3A7